MPLEETANEIRERVRQPGLFQENSFRRITLVRTKPRVFAIIGRLKGETTTTIQSVRFPKEDDWTLSKAGAWLADHQESLKSQKGFDMLEAPIVFKDIERQIATAPVLVPYEADADGEVVSKAQVEAAALEFMEKYQLVDKDHSFNKAAVPVESWLTRKDEDFENIHIPAGTWMMSVKVKDTGVWNGIMSGKYKGFSITAVRRSQAQAIKENVAEKKTLLQDIGIDDFVPVTVSIVENPAVKKATWIAVKSSDDKFFGQSNKDCDDIPLQNNKGEEVMEEKEIQALAEKVAEQIKKTEKEETPPVEPKSEEKPPVEPKSEEKPPVEPKKEEEESADKGVDIQAKIQALKEELLQAYDIEDAEEREVKVASLKDKLTVVNDLFAEKEEDSEEVAALKAENEKLKKAATKTRGIDGQDGEKPKEPEAAMKGFERDAHGRRIRA